ncbi:MAG TPA: ABC transporter ATP-binding protein [Phycisphaerae bacterium]|nr:ABC transporter ATP-binding protein [Phycisphaerae bacterium]
MPTGKSKFLNMRLPADLAALARSEGVDADLAWLVASTDLNLQGKYDEVFLVVEPGRLVTVGRPADGQRATRIFLRREDIAEIRTRQGIGGGFLEALVEGVYVDILAYSNARAETFHKVAVKLSEWREGCQPEVGPEDDYDALKCPECGMPLEFKGDICHRCIKRRAAFMRVLKMMRPYTGKAAIMMALVLVTIGISLIPQQLIRLLIDKVLNVKPPLPRDVASLRLLGLVGAMFGVQLAGGLLHMILGRLSSFVGTQITYDMRCRVFAHLARLGIGYYDRYNVGQLMSRVGSDTEQMKGFINQITTGFVAQFIQVIAVGAVLFTLSGRLAMFTLLPAPLVILAAVFFWKRIYPRYYRVWDANSKLHGVLNTILSGIRVVKAFGQEKREENRFSGSSGYVRDSFRDIEYTVAVFNPAVGLIFQLGGLIVWFVGGKQMLAEEMTLGHLMAFLGYLWMFYNPLSQLTQLTNWLTSFLTATQRTFEILDTNPEIVEAKQPKALADGDASIRFENATFGYSRHEPVIKKISFEVGPGEHVGIVGKSGSGKTTLVNLLARFYDVDSGRVLINGTDVRELKMDDLRRYVGIVLQEQFLFRGTIYANITYGRRSATPEQVLEAAKAANAHNFIIRHPLGYDTFIGERGAGLSGGERQRISIARALLCDPKILVLDEATSNVDTESEQLIQEAMERVTRGRTTLIIAHRLSTLKNSDRIFVIDDGRIVEQGNHEQLMALKGLYYKLVTIQTKLTRGASVDTLAGQH